MSPRPPSRLDLPGQKPASGWLRFVVPALFLLARSAGAVEVPAYFSAALARFTPDAPYGWAYTLTVNRGAETSVESFDPGRPAGRQWELLGRNGRRPTSDEAEHYQRYRETNNAAAAARATFARGDLDYASALVVREDAVSATIRCRFRRDATEPMLAHLELFLTVSKQPAAVDKSTLRLVRPYSPVFGMKMDELEVAMTFSRPTDEHPGLPLATVSRFHGHVLWFWSIDENLRVSYSDYRRVIPSADRAGSP